MTMVQLSVSVLRGVEVSFVNTSAIVAEALQAVTQTEDVFASIYGIPMICDVIDALQTVSPATAQYLAMPTSYVAGMASVHRQVRWNAMGPSVP